MASCARHPLAWLLALALSLPCAAALAGPDATTLRRALEASLAMEAGEALDDTQTYRAGYFDGLLAAAAAMAEQEGGVCLPGCSCELREAVAGWLDTAPEGADTISDLSRFIRQRFACR